MRTPWRFAAHRLSERRGWLIRLTDTRGRDGWGEATPLPQLGTESPGRCRAWLAEHLPLLSGRPARAALAGLPAPGSAPPAARCGLETALLDLAARDAGVPLAHHLNAGAATSVEVNASAGALMEVDPARLRALARQGFRCIKLKAGMAPPTQELARLTALAAALPLGVRLRLDANRAWSSEQAEEFLRGLKGMPVALVEEPLAHPGADALAALQRVAPCPLGLDESLVTLDPETVPATVRVLKPMLQGGLLPSLALARSTLALVTTTLDGAIATHAAAHLAAAIGGPLAHGLATSGWLARDLAPSPAIRGGRLSLPRTPGLGCLPAAEWRP